jgi:hypothetical protein
MLLTYQGDEMTKEGLNIDRYTRARWSLAEIAAIIHNPHFPVSFRVLQTLTTGQLARIQTSPAEKGTRRGYDFVSLVKFLLAIRLMKVHGLPSRMLQAFFDSMDKGSFGHNEVEDGKRLHKILLPEMLDGYFIALVNDPPNDGEFQFYATEEKFLLCVRILALEGNKVPHWVPFSLGDTAREAMGRIDAWHSRKEYVTDSPGDYASKALERVEVSERDDETHGTVRTVKLRK